MTGSIRCSLNTSFESSRGVAQDDFDSTIVFREMTAGSLCGSGFMTHSICILFGSGGEFPYVCKSGINQS